MTFDYPIWTEIGQTLENDYKERYITPERFIKPNPLANLVVLEDTDKFFGTKVLNLFIAAEPYGWSKVDGIWTENWPPEGFEDAKQRHKDTYEKFTKYKTHVWTDFYLVSVIMGFSPESRIEEMMESVDSHLQDMCDELADYGFVYEGRIESAPESSFFKPKIESFWSTS